jgi:hypothetical protein
VLDNVQLLFNIVVVVLLLAILGFLFKLGQEVELNPQEILTSLRNSNAGVASGTERQKKAVDTMFGEALLQQYPLVAQLCNWRPDLGAFLTKNPNMVPYAAQLANGVVGMGVDKLPAEFQGMIKQFLGQQSSTPAVKKTDEKMPWE